MNNEIYMLRLQLKRALEEKNSSLIQYYTMLIKLKENINTNMSNDEEIKLIQIYNNKRKK